MIIPLEWKIKTNFKKLSHLLREDFLDPLSFTYPIFRRKVLVLVRMK